MTTWIVIWKVVLVAALGLFTLMAILTTIGGAIDIRKLFQRLRAEDSEDMFE